MNHNFLLVSSVLNERAWSPERSKRTTQFIKKWHPDTQQFGKQYTQHRADLYKKFLDKYKLAKAGKYKQQDTKYRDAYRQDDQYSKAYDDFQKKYQETWERVRYKHRGEWEKARQKRQQDTKYRDAYRKYRQDDQYSKTYDDFQKKYQEAWEKVRYERSEAWEKARQQRQQTYQRAWDNFRKPEKDSIKLRAWLIYLNMGIITATILVSLLNLKLKQKKKMKRKKQRVNKKKG